MAADPQPPAQPNIYAEFLPRLGRISVVIHLPTPSTHKTKVLAAGDALHLIVDHDGVSTRLRLPVKNRIAGEHLPGEVPPGHNKISWRLLPTPEETQAALHTAADSVPWSAAGLKPGRRIACQGCDEPIITEETIKAFKDLPSENWAEMMEFWHCHKPAGGQATDAAANTQSKASEDDLASRGYGANSIIAAQNSVGLVDLMTILFSRNDCNCLLGIKEGVRLRNGVATYTFARDRIPGSTCLQQAAKEQVNPRVCDAVLPFRGGAPVTLLFIEGAQSSSSIIPSYDAAHDSIVSEDFSGFRALDAHCHKCKTQLGRFDDRKNGISLFKWKLSIVDQSGAGKDKFGSAPPSLSQCLAAALIATQARSGSAKVVLQGETEAITVWILNPRVKFSCSVKQGVYAMKLLFQPKTMDEEEILLPDQVVREAKEILEQGNEYLPLDEKQRQFNPTEGPWTVSLLER